MNNITLDNTNTNNNNTNINNTNINNTNINNTNINNTNINNTNINNTNNNNTNTNNNNSGNNENENFNKNLLGHGFDDFGRSLLDILHEDGSSFFELSKQIESAAARVHAGRGWGGTLVTTGVKRRGIPGRVAVVVGLLQDRRLF